MEIGKVTSLKDRLRHFIRAALNGFAHHSEGLTLFYYRHRSPGVAAIIGEIIVQKSPIHHDLRSIPQGE
jgi:hypothetical protein